MFDTLTDRLGLAFKRFTDKGRLTPEDVEVGLREVRLALLEADVNYKVAREFIDRVRARAVGQDVLESLTPGQQVIKIVFEELVTLLGGEDAGIAYSPEPPTVILLRRRSIIGRARLICGSLGFGSRRDHHIVGGLRRLGRIRDRELGRGLLGGRFGGNFGGSRCCGSGGRSRLGSSVLLGCAHRPGGRRQHAGTLQELPHRIRWLGPGCHPVADALILELDHLGVAQRVVVAHRFDEATIPGRPGIRHHDPIEGTLLGAHALEPDLDCH